MALVGGRQQEVVIGDMSVTAHDRRHGVEERSLAIPAAAKRKEQALLPIRSGERVTRDPLQVVDQVRSVPRDTLEKRLPDWRRRAGRCRRHRGLPGAVAPLRVGDRLARARVDHRARRGEHPLVRIPLARRHGHAWITARQAGDTGHARGLVELFRRIYEKLQVHSRSQAVAKFLKQSP